MSAKKYLIIGGNSTIGSSLIYHLREHHQIVTSTTRHLSQINSNCLLLDLNSPSNFYPEFHDYVFLCASITNLAVCESEPLASFKINVDAIVTIAKKLLIQGSRVIFLSSNTVFDGETDYPNEDASYSFSTQYGKQKSLSEQQLLSLGSGITIVRISKLISFTSGRFKTIADDLKNQKYCELFNDLLISPISSRYLCNSLIKMAHANMGGIFHLSGEKDISYADFAILMAKQLGMNANLVKPIPAQSVIFKPKFSGLGMKNTNMKLNIFPEPILEVLSHLN